MESISTQPLKKELPTLQSRQKYCADLLKRKGQNLQYPLVIRIEPHEKCKLKHLYRTMVIDNQPSGIIYAVIRKSLQLKPAESIFLFTGDLLITFSLDFKEIYEKKKDKDGFLYLNYSDTNPF